MSAGARVGPARKAALIRTFYALLEHDWRFRALYRDLLEALAMEAFSQGGGEGRLRCAIERASRAVVEASASRAHRMACARHADARSAMGARAQACAERLYVQQWLLRRARWHLGSDPPGARGNGRG